MASGIAGLQRRPNAGRVLLRRVLDASRKYNRNGTMEFVKRKDLIG